MHNVAGLYERQEAWDQALEQYAQALQLAQAIDSPVDIFDEALALGVLLARLGRREEAVGLLRQAHALGKQLGHPQTEDVRSYLDQLEAV